MPSSAISDFSSESYFNPNKTHTHIYIYIYIYSAHIYLRIKSMKMYIQIYTNRDFTNYSFQTKKKLTL
jgi:hypothetical protein